MSAALDVVRIGNATLYLGDAREIVHELPKAALVASDAPYRLTSGGRGQPSAAHKPMMGGWMAGYDNRGAVTACDISWDEIAGVCRDGLSAVGDCYLMANDKNLFEAHRAALAAGFRFHNLLVWHKVCATANRWFMKDCEFTLYLYRGRARTILTPGEKQLSRVPQRDESSHPTEKPVLEMERYIRASARPGELVLDPFGGAGTTALVALRLLRRAALIELNPDYADMAAARIRRDWMGADERKREIAKARVAGDDMPDAGPLFSHL